MQTIDDHDYDKDTMMKTSPRCYKLQLARYRKAAHESTRGRFVKQLQ